MRPTFAISLALVLGISSPALAGRQHERNIVQATNRLLTHAHELRREAANFVGGHRQFWLATVQNRHDALEALFAVNRLVGSVETFHDLVDGRHIEFTYYSLGPAYQILRKETREVGRLLDNSASRRRNGPGYDRWVPDPFRSYVTKHLLGPFERLQDELESMGYIRGIEVVPYVPPTPPLAITELQCHRRKEYTYRVNLCVEGQNLDRTRLNVRLVRRMDPNLAPWEREIGEDELHSSRSLGLKREERCYFLRQIGTDVRTHQGDNVYVSLERPNGRGGVVEPCWQENVIDLSH
jgi:hypothetical protein